MASTDVLKEEYNEQSFNYDDAITSVPLGRLETQLLATALGDCTNFTVLDLGGGSGLRARQVLDLGATSVDVVDLSPEMLRAGQSQSSNHDKGDLITWYEADVSKPLDHLPVSHKKGSYDLVMANWVMDHAASIEALEGMWANVAAYLRPGSGRFVGTRCGDPGVPAAHDRKYGVWFKNQEPIPGGVRYRYETGAIDIEAASMEVSYSGSTVMHDKFGLMDVETVPYESAETVREDPEFWDLFLKGPFMAVVKARKRG